MKKKNEKSRAHMVCPSCGSTISVDQKILDAFKDEVRIELEAGLLAKEQKIEAVLEKNRAEIRKEIENQNIVKMRSKEKLIIDLRTQLQKVSQKLEAATVSQQLIGESQELIIEEFLANEFKNDQVIEIPKGINGADCILICKSKDQTIGSILIESKRTSTFSAGWLDKMRTDNLKLKQPCDATILITEAMPSDSKIIFKDGIWICKFEPESIKQLVLILRYGMLKLAEVKSTLTRSHDEKSLLYDYLCSPSFKLQMEAILLGYQNLSKSFEEEQKKAQAYYKLRMQTLTDMLNNTLELTNSMRDHSPSLPEIQFELRKAG